MAIESMGVVGSERWKIRWPVDLQLQNAGLR